ncbi:aminotransferase class I/II-fold pyridoxal phosphate-dependent enzyme [Nocardia sp. NPDC057227]|uniref:aminotransferase class I/II-fold pyridoxal phosphate-dependent enzyme n=1 Tax=Nocardia sp. NPDC057227 TaxID=3346056 RepID=UPI0036451C8A
MLSHPIDTNSADSILGMLRASIGDPSARGIAAAVEELIRGGQLPAGTRLPTVRCIAEVVGVSAATISTAWAILRREHLLRTDRRRGTVVTGLPERGSRRDFPGWAEVPLAEALPDRRLLPPVGEAFTFGTTAAQDWDADPDGITPELLDAVRSTWPYAAPEYAVANGGYEGALLALRAVVRSGGAVAVEQPTAPRILETLRAVHAVPIPVECDAIGPLPNSVARALRQHPSALLYQPRAQIPSGCTLTAGRAAALAEVLGAAASSLFVIEDDNVGPAVGRARSIGELIPGCTIVVRSYCKLYGIDLRTSVISGPGEVIDRIRRLQTLGMRGTSRILQDALAYLLRDPGTEQRVDLARARHRQRRSALARRLVARGIGVAEGEGLTLWVPVDDEERAIAVLRGNDIAVGAGSDCYIDRPERAHLQIGTAALPDDPELVDELAEFIAAAASPARHRVAS